MGKELEQRSVYSLDLFNNVKLGGVQNTVNDLLVRTNVPKKKLRLPGQQVEKITGELSSETMEWDVDQ